MQISSTAAMGRYVLNDRNFPQKTLYWITKSVPILLHTKHQACLPKRCLNCPTEVQYIPCKHLSQNLLAVKQANPSPFHYCLKCYAKRSDVHGPEQKNAMYSILQIAFHIRNQWCHCVFTENCYSLCESQSKSNAVNLLESKWSCHLFQMFPTGNKLS